MQQRLPNTINSNKSNQPNKNFGVGNGTKTTSNTEMSLRSAKIPAEN